MAGTSIPWEKTIYGNEKRYKKKFVQRGGQEGDDESFKKAHVRFFGRQRQRF